jgi:hypothetical protein
LWGFPYQGKKRWMSVRMVMQFRTGALVSVMEMLYLNSDEGAVANDDSLYTESEDKVTVSDSDR